jgi:phage replication initiation protein
MGCHVEMTGQGCRLYEGHFPENPWQQLFSTVLAANAKFTRLDLAIDNVDGSLTLDKVWSAIQDHEQQIRTQFKEWRRIQKGSFEKGKQITGDTIYLGSTKSHIQFRIYDKAQESGVDGHWIRFEIQLRDKRAHEAAKLFAAGEPVGTLATGIINNYFSIINNDDANPSRCSLQSWWSEWLQTTEKIRLTTEQSIKLVSDTMEFIKRQYAPSLAMINKHLGTTPFRSFVQEILEDGKERLSAKHERILAASEAVDMIGRGK